MSWIVAVTKPKAEWLAKHHLERQGYGVYMPLIVTPDSLQPVPMFPTYVFVDLEPCAGQWRPINNTQGISGRGVLKTGEAPSVVPQNAIDLLLRREEAGVIRLRRKEVAATLAKGQPVRIHEGPFMGFEAVFERESADACVMVLLSILGDVREVHVPADEVSPIPQDAVA